MTRPRVSRLCEYVWIQKGNEESQEVLRQNRMTTACTVMHTWLILPASRALSFLAPDRPMHSELRDKEEE
jgi:hypothetical protein